MSRATLQVQRPAMCQMLLARPASFAVARGLARPQFSQWQRLKYPAHCRSEILYAKRTFAFSSAPDFVAICKSARHAAGRHMVFKIPRDQAVDVERRDFAFADAMRAIGIINKVC